jgi:acetyltransferase-like isoleucine patch superfamily enzyme
MDELKDNIFTGKYTYGISSKNVLWDGEAWIRDDKKIKPRLIVGNYCSVGYNPIFYLGGNHRYDWISTYPFQDKRMHNKFDSINDEIDGYPSTNGDIIIGNDVWLGECVTVMSGITIGDGAVIGTNSTVTRNVEPYSIVGGNPARHIKYRFNQETIENLLEIQWWNFDEDRINDLAPLLTSTNVEEFIEKCYSIIKNEN